MGDKKLLIILDEITFVEEWWRAIKARIDRRVFKNDVLLITGSASLELVRRKEQFPGRRGSGRDFILHPLDFSRYAEIFGNLRLKRAKLEKLRRIEGCMRANRIFSEPKLAARRLAESRKGERYMKEVISYILQAMLSPVSWLGIARETSVSSPHTARAYVETWRICSWRWSCILFLPR
ncbi:AAA family ATPase [Candidatus Pyrohabitans sp.]